MADMPEADQPLPGEDQPAPGEDDVDGEGQAIPFDPIDGGEDDSEFEEPDGDHPSDEELAQEDIDSDEQAHPNERLLQRRVWKTRRCRTYCRRHWNGQRVKSHDRKLRIAYLKQRYNRRNTQLLRRVRERQAALDRANAELTRRRNGSRITVSVSLLFSVSSSRLSR